MAKPNKIEQLSAKASDRIDYKEIELLKSYLTEAGKIIPSRVTNTSAYNQRRIARAIKQARFLALIPYTEGQ